MVTRERSDEELLSARDPEAFEAFYLRHVHTLLGYFARRTQDPELAADLPPRRSPRRPRRRLGMDRLEVTDRDVAAIEALGASVSVTALLEPLTEDQRSAVRAHVMDERGYDEIARGHHTTEAVIRKRVSRGLAAVRRAMGPRP